MVRRRGITPGGTCEHAARAALCSVAALTIGCLTSAGCGRGAVANLRPLAADTRPHAAAAGLRHRADVAGPALTYGVALSDRQLITVELGVAFALVIREITPSGHTSERSRIALGSATYDIDGLAVDAGRARAFVASRDGRVRAFDTRTGALLVTWHLGSPATAVAASSDGRWVAMGTADGVLCLRRYRDGALMQCALAHAGHISDLAFSPDSQSLASTSWTGELTRWRVPSLAILARHAFDGSANALAFSPDGTRIAVAHSGFPPTRLPAAAMSARERSQTRPAMTNIVAIWHGTDRSASPTRLVGHRGPVTSVAWTPDGTRVLSGSWDRSVRIWDVAQARQLARHRSGGVLVRDVDVDPTGRFAAVGVWTNGRDGRASALLDLLYRR